MTRYGMKYFAPENESGAPQPEPEATPAPVPVDWRAAKIIKQKAEIARLNNELAAKNATALPAATPAPQATALTEADVERRAAALADERSFTEQCVAAAAAGVASFGKAEFETRVNGLLEELREPTPKGQAAWNDFLQAALDTGDASKVLFELGSDMAEAERIFNLPPLKRVLALSKFATKDDRQISATPKPLPKVGARSNSSVLVPASDPQSDRLSSNDWHARRNAEIAESRAARGRR